MSAIERLRGGAAPFVLYPLLALLAFPVLGLVLWGHDGLVYAHDVLDLPRSGVPGDWVAHGLTLWNTHVGGGNALLAQQAIGPFAVDVMLAPVVGSFWAFTISWWLLPVVAGISMHLFLRDCLGLSTIAVVGGAILFMSGFWHPVYGFGIPATPALLWLFERAVRPSPTRWRYGAAHAVVGGVILYNGQVQVMGLVAAIELVWAVLVIGRPGHVRRAVATWTAAWAASFLLYGPVLVTQAVVLPLSQRTVWVIDAVSLPSAVVSTVERYSGTLVGVPVGALGRSPSIYGTFFLGLAAIPLLALAWTTRRVPARSFVLALLVAVPVLDLVFTLAWPLQEQLGVLRSLQLVRIRHLFVFALTATAAIGLDVAVVRLRGWTPRAPGARTPWRRRALLLGWAVLVVVTAIVIAANLVAHRGDVRRLAPDGLGWVLMAASAALGTIALVATVLTVRGTLRPSGRLPATLVLGGLLLLAGERSVYAHAERLLDAGLSTWRSSVDRTPAQAFLLAQPGSDVDRVLTFGEDANRMGGVGLVQADGYQAIYPLGYHALFGQLIRPQLDIDPTRAAYFDEWGNRAMAFGPNVDPELVALAGARWLYVRQPPGPDYNRSLYRELPWVPSVPAALVRYRDAGATVYEVPTVLPRAFLAGRVRVEADEAGVVAALGAASLDDLRGTLHVAPGVDADALVAALGGDASGGVAGSATIGAYEPDRVSIDVAADRPGVLVITDLWAPGWDATLDGAGVPIHRVDAAFRGVVVQPGSHRVELRYRPWFTYAGFGLAFASLAMVLAWAIVERRRDRRSALAAGGPADGTAGG